MFSTRKMESLESLFTVGMDDEAKECSELNHLTSSVLKEQQKHLIAAMHLKVC